MGERPNRPRTDRPDGATRPGNGQRGDNHGDRDGRRGDRSGHDRGHRGGHHRDHSRHHDHHDHHYYWDIHHHYYSHGHAHHYSHYGHGLWISFRLSPFYYCPTYREVSYVYVSPRYAEHRYYGLSSTGTRADRAVSALESGWALLEEGRYTSARSAFARAASYDQDWGLPKIGYAMAQAASGREKTAVHIMRDAFAADPYAALEVPYSLEIDSVLALIDDRFTDLGQRGIDPQDTWFMAAAVRLMLGDSEGAADAAFAAEVAGDTSPEIEGLLDVLAGSDAAAYPGG